MFLRLCAALFLVLVPYMNSMAQSQPPQGAFFTGSYPNLLSEWGLSDEEIQTRIDQA